MEYHQVLRYYLEYGALTEFELHNRPGCSGFFLFFLGGGFYTSGDSVVIDTITVGATPLGVVVTPDGSTVYVAAGIGSGSVSVIDTATGRVTKTIAVGRNPYGVVVTPDGSTAYVTNWASGSVSVIAAGTPLLTPTPSRAAAVSAASTDASTSSTANASASAGAGAAAVSTASNGSPAPAAYELAGTGVNPIVPLGAVTIFLLAGLALLLHRRQTQCEAGSVRVDTLN